MSHLIKSMLFANSVICVSGSSRVNSLPTSVGSPRLAYRFSLE